VILLLCGWMMVAAGTVRATYQDDLNGGGIIKKYLVRVKFRFLILQRIWGHGIGQCIRHQ